MTSAEVKQWIEGFEAAAEFDRAALQAEGPRLQWSISVALSLIEQARQWTEFSRPDSRREEDVEKARLVWASCASAAADEPGGQTLFFRAVTALRDALEESGAPFVFIGGVAVIAPGSRRLGRDPSSLRSSRCLCGQRPQR